MMACAVQSYRHQLETEIELSNELDNAGYFATLPPSLDWPISCGGLELDLLPTEDGSVPEYYQEQPNDTLIVPETGPTVTFLHQEKGWWDSELAPSVYKTLKEREQCLAKIEYRSPQLMNR